MLFIKVDSGAETRVGHIKWKNHGPASPPAADDYRGHHLCAIAEKRPEYEG